MSQPTTNLPEDLDLEKLQREVFAEIDEIERLFPVGAVGEHVVTTIKREDIPKPPSLIVPKPLPPKARKIAFITPLSIGVSLLVLATLVYAIKYQSAKVKNILDITPNIVIKVLAFIGIYYISKEVFGKLAERASRKRASQRIYNFVSDEEWMRQRDEETKQLLARTDAQKKLYAAEAIVDTPDFRSALCPALLSLSDGVFEGFKSSKEFFIPIVTASALTNTPTTLIASIAVVLARAGIASICAGYTTKK